MRHPLISIIVPAYNSARYLAEALDSALAQNYEPKELIVVDDGSTDETSQIIARYGNRLEALRQPNQGSAVARNAGIAASRGEYIAFLDADDLWLPDKLCVQARYLDRHPEVGMVYSRWDVQEESALTPARADYRHQAENGIDPERSGWLYNQLLFDCIVHTTTVVLRRSIAERVGPFDARYRRGQDYDYWLRVSRLTEIHCIARVLSVYRQRQGSITNSLHPMNYGYEVLSSAIARFGVTGPDGSVTPSNELNRRLAQLCFDFGYQHFQRGDPKIASRAFLRSIRHRPYRPKSWALLAASGFLALTRRATRRGQVSPEIS